MSSGDYAMVTTEPATSISKHRPVSLASAEQAYLTDDRGREKWQTVIDYTLIQLGSKGKQLEIAEEGMEPPSPEILRLAIELAKTFQRKQLPPPDSVVADPNGGIVFRIGSFDSTEVIHICDDASIELQIFQKGRIVEQRDIS